MTPFRWRENLSVGIPEIDRDHRRLIDILNRLHYMALAGDDRAAIGRVIDEVVAYTRDHFRREERLMREIAYPQALDHQAQHRAFAERLAEEHARFYADPEGFSVEGFYDALADWLLVHVSAADSRLQPYVKALAAKSAA